MSIKGVLFDKDGVLVDFDATWNPAAIKVMETLAAGNTERYEALAKTADFDLETSQFRKDAVFIAGTASELIERWAPILPDMPKHMVAKQSRDLFTRFGAENVKRSRPMTKRSLHALKCGRCGWMGALVLSQGPIPVTGPSLSRECCWPLLSISARNPAK